MTTPPNHHLTITDSRGKQIRGQVVYLQPINERLQPQSTVVHIVTSDWLGSYSYVAVYSTPSQVICGRYTPYGYSDAAGQWLLMGTFERDDGEPKPLE